MAEDIKQYPKWYEALVLALVYGSVPVILAGAAVAVGFGTYSYALGIRIATVGLMLAVAGLVAGYQLRMLRKITAASRGSARYEQLRRWNRLKVTGLLLNLLTLLAAGALLTGVLSRLNAVEFNISAPALTKFCMLLVAVLSTIAMAAYAQGLRMPLELDRRGLSKIFLLMGIAATCMFAILAVFTADRDLQLLGGFLLGGSDAALFLLGGVATYSFCLTSARSIPTLKLLFSEERSFYRGQTYHSRSKSVVMPAMVAFSLLFLLLLVFVVFGLGLLDSLDQGVTRSYIMIGVATIMIALLVSLMFAMTLARQEDRVELYKKIPSKKRRFEIALMVGSISGAVVLALISLLLHRDYNVLGMPRERWFDFLCFAFLVGIGPYGFYAAHEHKRIRQLEERFPDFLRDLAASHKGGLTLVQSAMIAARGEYGPLTPEICRMADQLSWNVAFDEALERFGERVSTPLIQRATTLILEASRSGGNTEDVLLAAARDAREIKNMENERRISMSVYTIVIYVTFFVFLVVAGVLYDQFVPQIIKTTADASGSSLGGVQGISGAHGVTLEDYRIFFFAAAVVQGLGDGIVAGTMGNGQPRLGLRHSFVMVLITYLVFALFLN